MRSSLEADRPCRRAFCIRKRMRHNSLPLDPVSCGGEDAVNWDAISAIAIL